MSQEDSLRLVAEVVDRFSGPLKSLRAQLQGMRPGDGLKQIEKAATGAEKAIVGAGKGISQVLTPALATVGVGGLSAAAGLAAVGAAMRSFSSETANLSRLGREVGMTAGQLREFGALGEKFGVSTETMNGSIRSFADNMRQFRRGEGPLVGWLSSQGAAAVEFRDKLRSTGSDAEALLEVFKFETRLPNGTDRKTLAERFGLSGELGGIGSTGLPDLMRKLQDVRDELGKLPADAGKNAEALENAFTSVRNALVGIRDAVGSDLAPQITAAGDALGKFFAANRAEIVRDLSGAFQAIAIALKGIKWNEVGTGFTEFLRGVEDRASAAIAPIKALGDLLSALEKGNWRDAIGALRRLDGADGPLARYAAPQAGDAAATARGNVVAQRDQVEMLKEVLRDAEEMGDKTKVDRLKDALTANSTKLKELEDTLQKIIDQGGATPQQQSYTGGGGSGLAGLIHRASLSTGGGGSFGGGAGNDNSPFRVSPRSGGPGERTGKALKSLFEPSATTGANPGAFRELLDHIAKSEGTAGRGDYNASLDYGRWLPGGKDTTLTDRTLKEIDQLQTGMLASPENRAKYGNGQGSSAIGRYQIVRKTLRGLRRNLGLGDGDIFDAGMQDRLAAELARARGPNASLGSEWASLRGKRLSDAIAIMSGIGRNASTTPGQRVGNALRQWPSGWRDGATTGEQPDWSKGVGRDFDAFKGSGAMLGKAREAGIAGGANISGSVGVTIERPGPDTRVKTQSEGELFREVKLNRARSMTLASQVA